jgi:hypothetical protein
MKMLRLGCVRLFIVALFGFCLSAAHYNAASFTAISGFQHAAWTARDNAPSIASTFAQTPDGYLWIGSPLGLYRFDGVQFEKIQRLYGARLTDGKISTLFTDNEGGLWIGYAHGGISLFKGNRVLDFGEAEGFRRTAISFISRRIRNVAFGQPRSKDCFA